MNHRTRVILTLTLTILIAVFATYFMVGRNRQEIHVVSKKKSPDGKWTAVVQMEVYSASAFVDVAVYAVRLEGPTQKDRQGDLVMNVQVNYPDSAPSIDWDDGKLVVTLSDHESYQYLENPVNGVAVIVLQK